MLDHLSEVSASGPAAVADAHARRTYCDRALKSHESAHNRRHSPSNSHFRMLHPMDSPWTMEARVDRRGMPCAASLDGVGARRAPRSRGGLRAPPPTAAILHPWPSHGG